MKASRRGGGTSRALGRESRQTGRYRPLATKDMAGAGPGSAGARQAQRSLTAAQQQASPQARQSGDESLAEEAGGTASRLPKKSKSRSSERPMAELSTPPQRVLAAWEGWKRRRRSALETTNRLEKAIAPPAHKGLSWPKAATGMSTAL